MLMGSEIPRRSTFAPIQITRTDTLSRYFGTKNFKQLVDRSDLMLNKVNNESSEIIRIFNSAFDELLDEEYAKRDFYPEPLRQDIDAINSWVYDLFNNGVYKTGFASKQDICMSVCFSRLTLDEENVRGVFQAMDRMEKILSSQKYLAGEKLSEADIRSYTTAARFDVAYHGAFKCNIRLLRSYPHLNRWLKSIYWSEEYPEFKETTHFDAVCPLLI